MLTTLKGNMGLPDLKISYEKLSRLGDINLTPKEIDILSCIMRGRTSKKSIASVFSISYRTVETHLHNILKKINASSWEFIRDKVEELDLSSLYYQHFDLLSFKQELINLLPEIINLHASVRVCFLESNNDVGILSKFKETLGYLQTKGLSIQINSLSQESTNELIESPGKLETTILLIPYEFFSKALIQNNSFNAFAYSKEHHEYDLLLFFLGVLIKQGSTLDNLRAQLQKIRQNVFYNTKPHNPSSLYSLKRSGWRSLKFLGVLKSFKRRMTYRSYLAIVLITLLVSIIDYIKTPTLNINVRSDLILPEDQYLLSRPSLRMKISNELYKTSIINNNINIVTLVGLGGAGKTTISRVVAKEHNGLVWEINAESINSLTKSFKDFAYSLAKTQEDREKLDFIQRISDEQERNQQILFFVKGKLLHYSNWLILFDNVECLRHINGFIPQDNKTCGSGHILITTRDETLSLGKKIYVEQLSDKETLDLYLRVTHQVRGLSEERLKSIKEFLKQLPPYPLDIFIAGKYIAYTNTEPEHYLSGSLSCCSHRTQVSILNNSLNYPNTRKEIICKSLDKIISDNHLYIDLLQAFTYIESNNIPTALLAKLSDKSLSIDLLYALRKYSLINIDSKNKDLMCFSIHRSIQEEIRDYCKQSNVKIDEQEKVRRLLIAFEKVIYDSITEQNYQLLEIFYHHLKKVSVNNDLHKKNFTLIQYCLTTLETYLFIDKVDVLGRLLETVQEFNKSPEENNDRMAFTYSNLGNRFVMYGNYREAKCFLEKSYQLLRSSKESRTQHVYNLKRLSHLYRIIGLYEQAIQLCDECYKLSHTLQAHTEIKAECLFTEGLILRDLGEYKKANTCLEEALLIRKVNKQSKSLLSWAEANLATNYLDLGLYSLAKDSFQKSLDIFERTYGSDSPYVAWCLGYLGKAQLSVNDSEVLRTCQKALKISQQAPYTNYTYFKILLPTLGKIYLLKKDCKNARYYLEKSLFLLKQHYGSEHFQTGEVLCLLGELALIEGHFKIAEENMLLSYRLYKEKGHTNMYIPLESLTDLYLEKYNIAKNNKTLDQKKYYIKAKEYLLEASKIILEKFPVKSEHVKRIKLKMKKFG